MDENLGHGLYTTLIYFNERACELKVLRGPTLRPPNCGYLRRVGAQLARVAGKKRTATLYGMHVTPERARKLRRAVLSKERRINKAWRERVVAWLRCLVRANRDAKVVVLADLMETLSGRVRRVVKEVENLCAYEGAEFVPLRASG